MNGRPQPNEAAPYFFTYIDKVVGDNVLQAVEEGIETDLPMLSGISEEESLHRYAPGKWSIREVLSHVNDAERAFAFRALWFGRGLGDPLPSFDPDLVATGAQADAISWAAHVEEFQRVRLASLSFFRNLPAEAWMRTGTAGGNPFTVRALAFVIAGHATHHSRILREMYLTEGNR